MDGAVRGDRDAEESGGVSILGMATGRIRWMLQDPLADPLYSHRSPCGSKPT